LNAPDAPAFCGCLRQRNQASVVFDEAASRPDAFWFQAGAACVAPAQGAVPPERLWKAQLACWQVRPPFRKGQGIALVGGSGCGKSTLARKLGSHLGLPVLDLDTVAAARAGKPIARIFAEDGEPAFRKLEAEVTAEAMASPAVLALGGGAWETAAIREAARRHDCAVLWIAEEPSRVWNRIARDPERPLAQEREVFIQRWRTRMPRWMEQPMVLPLGRTAEQLAAVLGGLA
jgi:shikimate kinase